ncbi:MAG TPA: shikimate dehydrogenase [Stellaceae bacterium]|nr:shikimate dehydrogenase [Stellaceae bacterium]
MSHGGGGFRLAGLIGWPVSHSRSPRIHNYWIERHGLVGAYVPLAVRPDRLAEALRGLSALDFAGCNVTIPHKEAVLRLVDEVDPIARRIGAVNTVVVGVDGRLAGRNTDAVGFIESLREAAPSWRADLGPAVVMGAGGGARAVVASLAERGAREIRVLNRTPARAAALAAEFGAPVSALPWERRADALSDAALLVNATSQGMHGQQPLELSLDRLPTRALVCDIVYIPLETPLLATARGRGNPTVGGLGMLLYQARAAFESWFGVLPEVTPELRRMIEATI